MSGSLDRLDERHAGWLRRRPELGFLLIAVVFVAAAAVHAARYDPERGQSAPERLSADEQAEQEADAERLIGPQSDDDPEDYVMSRYAELAALAESDPDVEVAAIVSFDAYVTAAQAAALFQDVAVRFYAARYRLRAVDGPVGEAPPDMTRGQVGVVGDLEAALLSALEREAQQAREQANELEQMAGTTDDPEFAQTFRADRDRLLAAAGAAGPACECVYAVLLEGSHVDLAELAVRAGIRLVDPAPAGSEPGTVIFFAVPPEA